MTTDELGAVARDTIAIYERIVAHRERLTAANTTPHHTPRLNVTPAEEAARGRAELARAYLALTEPPQ